MPAPCRLPAWRLRGSVLSSFFVEIGLRPQRPPNTPSGAEPRGSHGAPVFSAKCANGLAQNKRSANFRVFAATVSPPRQNAGTLFQMPSPPLLKSPQEFSPSPKDWPPRGPGARLSVFLTGPSPELCGRPFPSVFSGPATAQAPVCAPNRWCRLPLPNLKPLQETKNRRIIPAGAQKRKVSAGNRVPRPRLPPPGAEVLISRFGRSMPPPRGKRPSPFSPQHAPRDMGPPGVRISKLQEQMHGAPEGFFFPSRVFPPSFFPRIPPFGDPRRKDAWAGGCPLCQGKNPLRPLRFLFRRKTKPPPPHSPNPPRPLASCFPFPNLRSAHGSPPSRVFVPFSPGQTKGGV